MATVKKDEEELGYVFAGDVEFYRKRFVQCDHCMKIKRGLKNKGHGCVFKNLVVNADGKSVKEDCTGIFDDYERTVELKNG